MRVRRLSRGVTRIYDEELRPFGVNVAQLNLLVALGSAVGLRASELSVVLDIEKSTLSRTLGRLLDQGLIVADDAQRFELSPEGGKLLRAARPAWARAQRRTQQLLGKPLFRLLAEIPT